jgi:hypothetical protein
LADRLVLTDVKGVEMNLGMRTIQLDTNGAADFLSAKQAADDLARRELTDPVCLSWHDAESGRESPAHVSECHTDCDIPGSVEYAENRGGELAVVVDDGRFTFCYRSLGEFAAE